MNLLAGIKLNDDGFNDQGLPDSELVNSFHEGDPADKVWQALLEAEAFVKGQFELASGTLATLKVDAEQLYRHPKQLDVIIGLVATYPCTEDADLLLDVPDGWRDFTTIIGYALDIPVVHPRKTAAHKFAFASAEDEYQAREAESPLILEDVVTTLGSVAALRSLLPEDREVHSLAVLLRGNVNPSYQIGLRDHYLLEKYIPTDKDEFSRLLS